MSLCLLEMQMNPPAKQAVTTKPTEISDLSDDLVEEILFRLPLRPLHASKCVSRKWQALLASVSLKSRLSKSTGVFTYDDCGDWGYLRRFPEDDHQEDLNAALDTTLSFLPCFPDGIVVAGSNGLLLATSRREKRGNFFVCNPLTKKYCEVPRPRTVRGTRMRMHSVALDYNPKSSPFFKIIFYRYSHDFRRRRPVMRPLEIELEIFSSEMGKWVHSEVTEWACASCTYTHMTSLNGVIYRLANKEQEQKEQAVQAAATAAKKMKALEVQEIRLPIEAANASYGSIGQAGGSLYYSYGDEKSSTVWVLKEEEEGKSEWAQVYHIEMKEFARIAERDLGLGNWRVIVYQPMVFLSHHELAFLLDSGDAVIYDCNLARFKKMDIVRLHGITSARFKAFPFTPCLDDPSAALLPEARASTSG